jgi:uncharacterized damage-inducible protein DinB
MARTEGQRIADHLRRSVEGEAWHGPALLELLEGVTSVQAAARPVTGAHSIWDLTMHVTTWMRVALKRVNGEAAEVSPQDDWPAAEGGEEGWKLAVGALELAAAELIRKTEHLDESALSSVTPGEDYTLRFLLHGVVQHNLYHAGQIAMLKKALLPAD